MSYNDLKRTILEAENILFSIYNIKAEVSELPGDVDFNFRVKLDQEDGYILKVSRPDQDEEYLEFQQSILQHVESNSNITISKTIRSKNGNLIEEYTNHNQKSRKLQLLTWIPGRLWSSVNPHSNSLRFSLGNQCEKLTKVLKDFNHVKSRRTFEWDIAQSLWTKEYNHLFDFKQREIITHFQSLFEQELETYQTLRKSVVHNDVNDNNILVSEELIEPKVQALIDYGDAIYTQIINDVAITCAYAIMHHKDPLEASLSVIKGYHNSFPLQQEELTHLYHLIAMRLVISVTKSAINKIKEPDNEYLLISEKSAWEVLINKVITLWDQALRW